MYPTHAPRASLTVLSAALALSFVGCVGTVYDTPNSEQNQQNVGAGSGVEDDDSSDDSGDPDDSGDGDGETGDGDGDTGGDGDAQPPSDESNDPLTPPDDGAEGDGAVDVPEDPPDDPTDEPPPSDTPEDPPADPPAEPPVDEEAASLSRGEDQFDSLCVGCHGANGQGSGGVTRGNDLNQLASYIDNNMPLGNSNACDAQCSEDIARYILATF